MKRRSAGYRPGPRRTRDVLKVKFCQDVDVVVRRLNRKGKASLAVELYEADGTPVDVGAVTVNNASLQSAKVGDVVTVRYLYADKNRRLVQPAGGRVRTDKRPEDCTIDQLKFTNKEVLADG